MTPSDGRSGPSGSTETRYGRSSRSTAGASSGRATKRQDRRASPRELWQGAERDGPRSTNFMVGSDQGNPTSGVRALEVARERGSKERRPLLRGSGLVRPSPAGIFNLGARGINKSRQDADITHPEGCSSGHAPTGDTVMAAGPMRSGWARLAIPRSAGGRLSAEGRSRGARRRS